MPKSNKEIKNIKTSKLELDSSTNKNIDIEIASNFDKKLFQHKSNKHVDHQIDDQYMYTMCTC